MPHVEKLKEAGQLYDVSLLWVDMVNELAPEFTPNVEWWRMIANNMLQLKIYEVCLVLDNDNIVGFLDWFLYPEPSTGKLHAVAQHLYVKHHYRNTTVSGNLCRFAYKSMRDAAAQCIELACFNDNINLWGRKKFKPIRTMMRREIYV